MPPPNYWIIEDEPPALRRLTRMVKTIRPKAEIKFTSDSVKECRRAIAELPLPDLIFSDIHLADGHAFDIWEDSHLRAPIIFTTAYDQYSIRAFRVNSIDYLLKPIEESALARAITKAEGLHRKDGGIDLARLSTLLQNKQPVYRERFLVQHRQEWLPIQTADLRQLYSSEGLTFGLHSDGRRYLLDESLDRLEAELNPAHWFRINRAQIIHVESVRKLSPYFNHRIVLDLQPAGELENIVSRARVKACKAWLGN
ncbi:DNA-binding response regulator [Lewinellaceae bacterium SD302]|nr:DNA-binding response regulator [Lewinellaceae bacterium SD302]